jgi:hypothetical protein
MFGIKRRFGELRQDEHGFGVGSIVGTVVGGFVAILVALILIPTVSTQEYVASKNTSTIAISGATGLLPLIPLLFILTAVIVPVILALYVLKEME